ncbi:enoyl-CoA hydratase/isomerase family protein [Fodinicola acaciae]|uniref:enoyl-CoA hydratase/isomerase family protein n=1 Tax=Fodinicola acaciae TaxID=2681555 RepID=UPI0013D00ED5|nr:enoyl-CoA hydratase-related protein [Fodinicola acaciae]
MTDPVLLTRQDAVATVTINRPHRRNALDEAAWLALHAAIVDVRDDPGVRALVVTGADGSFCAGADLSGGQTPAEHPLRRMHEINRVALELHQLTKPVVAKVRGVAVGAGWNLALGCDIVVAGPDARFSQIFSKRGLSLDFGGSWLLPRIVGLQAAKRLALTGDFVDAAEALRLGLVSWVVDDEKLDAFVDDLAVRLAAGPSVALAQNKQLLNASLSRSMSEALDAEAVAQTVNFATEDTLLAFQAFAQRTDPRFSGRWLPGKGDDER